MKRREFITLIGGAAAWPLAARAQQPKKIPRLCFLTFDPGTLQSNRFDAFFQGLHDLGYANGQNIAIDSKEMRESLKFGKALYDEGMTPEVFSWDDASDNRFLASGVASWIHDAISAFHSTRITNPKMFEQTFVVPEGAGPGGTWNVG